MNNDIQIYDEFVLGLQTLSELENLLSGCSHEVSGSGISLLIEPITERLYRVKEAMQKLQSDPMAERKAHDQHNIREAAAKRIAS